MPFLVAQGAPVPFLVAQGAPVPFLVAQGAPAPFLVAQSAPALRERRRRASPGTRGSAARPPRP
nr:hypothetical protein [Angustibacter aerolatus]